MRRTTKPRLGIGVLLASLVVAPVFAAPSMAQEDGTVLIDEETIRDGVGQSPDDLGDGLATWWQRHAAADQAGMYDIADDPVNEGSDFSLHLGVAGDEQQARLVAYHAAAQRPDLREFFQGGLDYTLYLDAGDPANATQLVVEVLYGWDDSAEAPRSATLSFLPGDNNDVDGDPLGTGTWQTFEWAADSQTHSSAEDTMGTRDALVDALYQQAADDTIANPEAIAPVAIGVGLNLGPDAGAVSTYIDQLTVGGTTYRFDSLRPILETWTERAARGDTVTVTGRNLANVTVELNGAGEVDYEATPDGTELTFVVPETAALGDRHVVISNDYGETEFILRVLEGTQPHPGFTDVPETHLFFNEIRWLAEHGITRGCNPPANDRFCPDEPVSRGQMAAFLNRALGWPATDVDGFIDDGHSVFEGDLNAAKEQDVFRGCNPPINNRACPDDPISRGEMAAVIVRALGLPGSDVDAFIDDDLSVFEGDINALKAADITRGCNPPANNQYCPDRDMTRGEMAAFLYRALHDVLDQPTE